MADCVVTGTLYRTDNTPFGSQRRALTVVEVVKSGSLYMAVPLARDTNALGVVSFTVPQGSTAYVAADARGLNTNAAAGVALTIPSAATANLEDLVSVASIPTTGLTVKDEGAALATLIGSLNFVGSGVSVAQDSAGAATVTVTAGGGVTLREVDLSPSLTASTVEFQQASGFVVTDQTGGVGRVDLLGIPVAKLAALTASRALVSDSSGFLAVSGVTAATLAFLDATSSVQTQLNGKAASVHTHTESDVTGLVADLLALTNAVAGKQATLTNSAGLLAALSDETGTGLAVFNNTPTFITPILGTPQSGVLTSCTGLPPTTGIVGWPANASGVLTNNGSGTLSWGAGGSGANTALSNLASVAINTDLLPASNQSLGSATLPWLSSFTGTTTQYESVTQAAGVITHQALGSATNIGFTITPKGTGGVNLTTGLLQFGGTTSARGAIGIVGAQPTVVAAWLADGSAVATLQGKGLIIGAGAVAPPPTGSIQFSTSNLNDITGGLSVLNAGQTLYLPFNTASIGLYGAGSPVALDAALTRGGVNIIEVNNGSAGGLGMLLAGRVVTAKTGNYTVLSADKRTLFTNTGAAGTVVFTLPTAVKGLEYQFYRDANQTVQIVAGASTTIRVGATVTAAAGNVTLDAVGSKITLEAISATQWVGDLTGTATFT